MVLVDLVKSYEDLSGAVANGLEESVDVLGNVSCALVEEGAGRGW